MKKYTEKSLIVIKHINNEIGIDMLKYQNNEIFSKILDILMIQKYSLKSIYKPLIISLILFTAGFFLFNLGKISILLYSIFGLLFCLLNALLFGIIKLLSNLKNDLKLIISSSIDLTKNICSDLSLVATNIQNCKNPGGLVFEGIIAATVTPSLIKTFIKVPIAGDILMNGSDKILSLTVNEFKKYEDKFGIQKFTENGTAQLLKTNLKIESYITEFSDKSNKYVDNVFGTIQLPFKIMFMLTTFLTSIFILIFIFL